MEKNKMRGPPNGGKGTTKSQVTGYIGTWAQQHEKKKKRLNPAPATVSRRRGKKRRLCLRNRKGRTTIKTRGLKPKKNGETNDINKTGCE